MASPTEEAISEILEQVNDWSKEDLQKLINEIKDIIEDIELEEKSLAD